MDISFLRNQFDHMEQAAIDACSIIYLIKTGVFERLAALLPLTTTHEVFRETLWPRLPVKMESAPEGARSNDHGLFLLAIEKKIPLISDDGDVLAMAREKEWEHYNSLMMLIYLEYRGKISEKEYPLYQERLLKEAHYSQDVITRAQIYRQELFGSTL